MVRSFAVLYVYWSSACESLRVSKCRGPDSAEASEKRRPELLPCIPRKTWRKAEGSISWVHAYSWYTAMSYWRVHIELGVCPPTHSYQALLLACTQLCLLTGLACTKP